MPLPYPVTDVSVAYEIRQVATTDHSNWSGDEISFTTVAIRKSDGFVASCDWEWSGKLMGGTIRTISSPPLKFEPPAELPPLDPKFWGKQLVGGSVTAEVPRIETHMVRFDTGPNYEPSKYDPTRPLTPRKPGAEYTPFPDGAKAGLHVSGGAFVNKSPRVDYSER